MLSLDYLSKINTLRPGNIYVENIRSAFGISRVRARTLCEMAVDINVFEKRIGFICPSQSCNQRIIKDFSINESIPNEVKCSHCEEDENDTCVYKTKDLIKVEFYQIR